ncbi:hypothetical protein SKA34_07533, partial [Photobacterium sp. SKA34]
LVNTEQYVRQKDLEQSTQIIAYNE